MAVFNKGDVSEGILAAAITARCISKTKRVTNNDIISVIKKLKKATPGFKGYTTITEFDSPNENPKIIDKVICKVNLAEVNMKAFQDTKIYTQKDIVSLVTAAAVYANGNYVVEWADLMYKNNQKNKIEVNAEGLLDQTGTKVDLKVIVDGIQQGIGISLKAGDVKQFGQVGGTKWESMIALFEPLGVKFTKQIEKQYIEMLANKQLAPALTTVYSEAVKQLQKLNQTDLQKNLGAWMKHHATSGEQNVALVQLDKNTAKVYDFDVLSKKLRGKNIDVLLSSGITDKLNEGDYKGKESMSKNKIPKLVFKIDNKDLVQIRLKLEGNRINSKGDRVALVVRSYVEKGPVTTQLLSK